MVQVAAVQMSMNDDKKQNINKAISLTKQAAKNGANIILLPELFESLYFCKDIDKKYFLWAKNRINHPLLKRFSILAARLHIVILVSYFEKSGNDYFNSLVVIDANGQELENYRKTHIPSGLGYEEKFYFKPGNSGFKVWDTAYGRIGAGICWDQWFCESARILTLKGAELIFYPSAIGSEPGINIDSKEHWQRVQMGHASTNLVPIITSNRFGKEVGESCLINFYGSSFITDNIGKKIVEASRNKEEIIYAKFDLQKNKEFQQYWGLLQDRRVSCYKYLSKNKTN